MTGLERDGVVVSPSLLRLEEADCALLGSNNTFDGYGGVDKRRNPDCWFAGDNEFILPADFERWFAEDDSAVELTPAVHVFLAVLNAVGSECCNQSVFRGCGMSAAPRKIYSPYATQASISLSQKFPELHIKLIVYNYVCTELLSPSVMKTVGSCYVTFPYIEVF